VEPDAVMLPSTQAAGAEPEAAGPLEAAADAALEAAADAAGEAVPLLLPQAATSIVVAKASAAMRLAWIVVKAGSSWGRLGAGPILETADGVTVAAPRQHAVSHGLSDR
jgi:hypothetical protein